MLLTVDTAWVLGTLLVALRLGALLALSPLFSLGRPPARVLVLVVFMFAAALNTVLAQYAALDIQRVDQLLIAMARELAVGVLMAFGLHCAFAAFSFGGRILDLQMGFGVANLINPSSHEQSPLLGFALLIAGALTFFLWDGHHWLARGLLQSYGWFPLAAPLGAIALAPVLQQFGLMFSLGFALVVPVVAFLLLIDVAMAIAARTMPQMNLFMLSMPVKILVGLSVLAASAPLLKGLFNQIFVSIFHYWQRLA